MAPLVVGITADRRWQEQADLFTRRGFAVLHGPAMRTLDLAGDDALRAATDDDALRAATDDLVATPPDWFVATTGMGVRAWLAAAEGWGLRDALVASLAASTVVARGAKATSALRQAGVDVSWSAPSESMAEVLAHLGGAGPALASARLAVQLFDPDDHPTTAALRALAATVVEVPVYRWLPPADPAPALHLVEAAIAGDVAAITFTSQPAVHFLFALADGAGRGDALRAACNDGRVLAVCIGPVCAEAGRDEGLTAMVWPEPHRLPPMVRLVAERLAPAGEASCPS